MATIKEVRAQVVAAEVNADSAQKHATNAARAAGYAASNAAEAIKLIDDLNLPIPPGNIFYVDTSRSDVRSRFSSHVVEGWDFRLINGRLQSKRNAAVNGIDVEVGKILFPINWMAPLYTSVAGPHIDTYSAPGDPNAHCQVRLSSQDLEKGSWTKPSKSYKWTTIVDLPASSDWANLSWVLPMQGHPGDHGPNWDNPHHRPPMIAIYMKRDKWQFWVRGSSHVNPRFNDFNSHSADMPFVAGKQVIQIDFRCDPLGGQSFARCKVNGALLGDFAHPVGINHSALGAGMPALNLAMGYYGTNPQHLPDPSRHGRVIIRTSTLEEL